VFFKLLDPTPIEDCLRLYSEVSIYPSNGSPIYTFDVSDFPGHQRLNRMSVSTKVDIIWSNSPLIAYHTELQSALQFVRESLELSIEEKRRFFKNASTNLGTSALCLSGGASFGYCKTETIPRD
jgi:hypothetical protein